MTFRGVGKRNTSWSLDPSMQSFNQRGSQGKSESETSSYSKRISAPNMWKRARVEELKVGRDGATITVVPRGPTELFWSAPIQLVIPL